MTVLGKRKQGDKIGLESQKSVEEIFRQHFESQFNPLDVRKQPVENKCNGNYEDISSDGEDTSEGEEWGGLSDEEGDCDEDTLGKS